MLVAGVMSGTSLDAIDVALTRISADVAEAKLSNLRIDLEAFHSVPWTTEDRTAMLSIIHHPDSVSLRELGRVNNMIARRIAAAVREAVSAAGLALNDVDIIASHGQTVFHDPPTSTLQIGDPAVIAAETGILTIGDFRVADMAAGGQGAPITSTMDVVYLSPPDSSPVSTVRAVQNIGGIGNVTFVPHKDSGLKPLAFDTGPGNVFIDMAAGKCATTGEGSHNYDKDGLIAASGSVCEPLLTEMLAHPYFDLLPPKTTGRELFTRDLFEKWWSTGLGYGVTSSDLVATFTELTARTIADSYKKHCPGKLSQVIVGGGGSKNPFLLKRIETIVNDYFKPDTRIVVVTHEDIGVSSEAKECLAFALLGFMAFHRIPNNIPECTGAAKPVVMGKLCYP